MKVQTTVHQDVFAPPASYAQERLWFLDRLEPGTAIYNIPFMATMRGGINRTAFNKAVNRLIARHESLRTCFIETAGKPRQVVHPELIVEVGWQDLGNLDARTSASRLQAICTEVTSTPFDLGQAPLFRIMLVAAGRETTIITTIHHIVSDGWSIGVFQRELAALYQEALGGRPAALPELRIQYADYALWQRETLDAEGLTRLKEFWIKQLEGATTVLELPTDYPRPLKQTFNGAVHMFDISPELSTRIRALATSQDVTLFMLLFAAFSLLLSRLTGQHDLLVGTPIAGRKGADVEHLIGLLVNTLVLRARFEPEQPFVDLLAVAKTATLDAFEHQDMPFEKLVLELNPKRDLSHSPLIQVLFSLQNIPPLQELLIGGAEADVGALQNLDGHTGTAKFDYALFVSEVGNALQCSVEFNTDLFSAATIADTGSYYVKLLEEITAAPRAPVSSYPLLSASQLDRCLKQSRGSVRAYSEVLGCHQLFERQCQHTPHATAIVGAATAGPTAGQTAGRGRMTYAELNAYTNRIARYLTSLGVRAGDTVGLCMPRGIPQIATLLGIVKAGAAYVPLDPENPLERLQFVVADSGARVLVTSRDTRIDLEACAGGTPVVTIEEVASEIAAQSAENLDTPHVPERPLYVIHTSGSTGRPKGVVMPHRAIVNLIEWQARESGAPAGKSGNTQSGITLQYASLNFDVASQEIWATLTSGGCLHTIDERLRRDVPRLLDYLKQQRVSRLFIPPVTLEQLANVASTATLDDLREVIVAGDKLQVTDQVRALFARAPRARLVNQYGPTESHVVSASTLEGDAAAWPSHPPIGKPIDNVQLYVLDEHLQLTPPNVAGELFIGGAAVALGYCNKPEESAKRFIEDPFADKAGATPGRLYRTGDVCRYDHEGVVHFIGRADQQIKLRGFRIEPGEIEVVLKAYERVTEAVVVKRPSRRGEDELAAFLLTEGNADLDKTALRGYLTRKLPGYMVPTHLIRLDRFPMTSTGKIDRKRLPDPADVEAEARRAAESTYIAPRTHVESFLAACWCELLQLDRVSIRDNFFELGGHSLSATQLVSRVRDEFGVELPLYSIFERPVVELLALEIVQRQASGASEDDLDALLNELESLSDEDSEALLLKTDRDTA